MVRFVILWLGRSGSSHLQSLLDSHPDITCFGEVFSDRAPADGPGFINSQYKDEGAYFEHLVETCEVPVMGFKLPMNSIKAHPKSAPLVPGGPPMRGIQVPAPNLPGQLIFGSAADTHT